MANAHWKEGQVGIPEEKKAEFNQHILELFRLCGIRKLKQVKVAENVVTVVSEPQPDEDGKVRFDYSVFEQRKRQVSFYDMKTCRLHISNCGYDEFGVVMNLVMKMQEVYSKETCGFHDYDSGHFKKIETAPFYQAIGRKNEDEFLEFKEHQELLLSDGMKRNMEKWKQKYKEADEAKAAVICTKKYLSDILLDLERIWGCRYADEKIVCEFTEHENDICYKKALLVFRELVDQDVKYFPELTVRQVREWVTGKCHKERDRINLSGYASMLVNHACRNNILEF